MSQLTRTTSGPFHLEDCLTLSELETAAKEDRWNQVLSSLDEGLGHLPSLIIEQGHQQRVWDGWELYTTAKPSRSTLVRVYSEQGDFCALYRLESTGFAKAEKVFREVNRDENH
jgi:tRNA pseudouridine55 synthase